MVGTRDLVPVVGATTGGALLGASAGFGTGMFKRQTGGDQDAPLTGMAKGASVGAALGLGVLGASAGYKALKVSNFTNAVGMTPNQAQLFKKYGGGVP